MKRLLSQLSLCLYLSLIAATGVAADAQASTGDVLRDLVAEVDRARGPASGRWTDGTTQRRYISPVSYVLRDAQTRYDAVIKKDPAASTHLWASYYLANKAIAEGRPDEAISNLEPLLKKEMTRADWSSGARLLGEALALGNRPKPVTVLVKEMEARGAAAEDLRRVNWGWEKTIRKASTPTIYPESGSIGTADILLRLSAVRVLTIYFTIDGSEPTLDSYLYRRPVYLENKNEPITVKARTFANGQPVGILAESLFDMQLK